MFDFFWNYKLKFPQLTPSPLEREFFAGFSDSKHPDLQMGLKVCLPNKSRKIHHQDVPGTLKLTAVSTWITRVGRFSFPFGVSASWQVLLLFVLGSADVSPWLLFGIPNFQENSKGGRFSPKKMAPHKRVWGFSHWPWVRMWCLLDTLCLLCCFF